jgi:5-methylcytosine-specific restriction endonuclease McrA
VNCHRWRTARRASWVRAASDWEQRLLDVGGALGRNLRLAYCHLLSAGCAGCGTRDLVVLEFDHVGPKSRDVMLLARDGASLAVLSREIAACVVRCANCHRRVTSLRAGSHRTTRTTLPGPS